MMKTANMIGNVVRMDLMRTIRDPFTLLFLCFPIVIYPIGLWALGQMNNYADNVQKQAVFHISAPKHITEQTTLAPRAGQLKELNSGYLDLWVDNKPTPDGAAHPTATMQLVAHHRRDVTSLTALKRLTQQLTTTAQDDAKARALQAGVPPQTLEPYQATLAKTTDASNRIVDIVAAMLGGVLPLSLNLALVGPGLALFVGGRVANTMEVEQASPISQLGLLTGRMITMCLFGVLGTLASYLSMLLTMNMVLTSIDNPPISILGVGSLTQLVILLVSYACLSATLLIALLAFFKTVNSAYNVSSIAVSVLGFLPFFGAFNDYFDFGWTWLPLVRTGHDLVMIVDAQMGWGQLGLSVGVDLFCAATVLSVFSLVFGTNSLLTGVAFSTMANLRPSWLTQGGGQS